LLYLFLIGSQKMSSEFVAFEVWVYSSSTTPPQIDINLEGRPAVRLDFYFDSYAANTWSRGKPLLALGMMWLSEC
jgi:hypothetical protein